VAVTAPRTFPFSKTMSQCTMEMINNSNIYAHKLIAVLIPILCRECSARINLP
jgi:hypothetical protein